MTDLTQLSDGDTVEWAVDDGKTAVGEIIDKYTATKGSPLSGDKRDVLTFKVNAVSDNVYEDTVIVDVEMDSLQAGDN